MVRKSFIIFIILIFSGCSSSSKRPLNVPPPGSVHEIRCKYRVQTCYYMARDRCLNSYKVLSQTQTERTGGPYGRYKEYITTIQCT